MNRYRSQGYYGRPQSQGPFHDPYQKGPSWGRGISQLIKNFMMLKQLQEQRGEEREEKEWEKRFEEKEQKRKFERWGAQEDLWKAQAERVSRPPIPPKTPDYLQKADSLVAEGVAKDRGEALSMILKIGREPTDVYSRRKGDLGEALKLGTITQEQYNKSLFNLKQELTPEQKRQKGATIRDGNMRELRDFFKTIPGLIDNKGRMVSRKLRKMVGKKEGGLPLSSQGYRLDMPEKYNRAILNKRDGVATVENLDVIAKYDAMFSVFRDRLMRGGIDSFKKYMTSPDTKDLRDDPNFDNGQIKLWYEIFKK